MSERESPATSPRGPIFILGAMGSGTTLLRLMLDSHPNIGIPHETGFMRGYKSHRFIPFKWSGRGWARRMGWSDAELDAEMAAFYDRLFRRYLERHGKQRWGEKTPLHTWHARDMRRLFPEAVFVVVLRHPGASIASNAHRFSDPFERFVLHWGRYTRELVRIAAAWPRRVAVLRYEDLVLQPERAMRELLDWLGEPWSDAVLAHHVVQGRRSGRKVVEGRTHVQDPIDVSRISKWTTRLNDRQRAIVRREHGELARFLGYNVDDPAVLEPLGARGRLLARDRQMRRKVRARPDLGLEVRGQVPRNEQLYDPRRYALVELRDGKPVLPPEWTPARRVVYDLVHRLPPGPRERLKDLVRS